MTVKARHDELTPYLAKHDNEKTCTILIDGLLAAVDPDPAESAKMVKKYPQDPLSPVRTMREQTRELLEHWFAGNSGKMISSLLS